MGLDLVVVGDDPDDEIEIDGFRIGQSTDFNHFRRVVAARLDRRLGRTRFPLLMRDGAWDASWNASEARDLERELNMVAIEFSKLPAEPQPGVWSGPAAGERTSEPHSLLESFVTIDGELFVLRFIEMAQVAQRENAVLRTH